MKAVLMAAGVGTRISRHIKEVPKSTVDLGAGQTLIAYTLSALRSRGVTDVTVVVGYRPELVRAALRGHEVRFFDNPFYHVTNSIASLWFARGVLSGDDDVILANADTYLDGRIWDQLVESDRSPVMLMDVSRDYERMDYKLGRCGDLLSGYGKELAPAETDGEYVGVAKIAREHVPHVRARLDAMIAARKSDRWWEDVLYELSSEGHEVFVEDVGGAFWGEVDYVEDYLAIVEHLRAAAQIAAE